MKQKIPNPQLSVFQTFKTKDKELTGEAIRQRGIIMHLALETIPTRKTRTALAHRLAEKNGTTWQNIYSGIFRDLDEILLPLGIVKKQEDYQLNAAQKRYKKKEYHITN